MSHLFLGLFKTSLFPLFLAGLSVLHPVGLVTANGSKALTANLIKSIQTSSMNMLLTELVVALRWDPWLRRPLLVTFV